MTQILPHVYIEPPAIEPYRFGLFGAAQPLTDADDHWRIGGVEWDSLASYVAALYPAGIFAPTDVGGRHTKPLPDQMARGEAWPFAVYAGVDCGSVGYDAALVESRARRILELSRQHAVESQLWTGGGATLLNQVGLNSTGKAATPIGSTAVSITAAVAGLEKWLGDNYAGRGLIHATRAVAPWASRARQVFRDTENEDARVTSLGTRWVFGAGYNGTGPAAAAPAANQSWVYATGQVFVAADEAITPADFGEALNRSNNRTTVIAEQLHMVGIDGPWAAALVDFTL